MPFSASLAADRRNGILALCGPLIPGGIWEGMPWERQQKYCKACQYRFNRRPSCSFDFMTISQMDSFQVELGEVLLWVSDRDPSWKEFDGSVYEVELAYHFLGHETPRPKEAVKEFINHALTWQESDGEFWKKFNYDMVEGHDARPTHRTVIAPEIKPVVDQIVKNVTECSVFRGSRLHHLYAACCIFSDVAYLLGYDVLDQIMVKLAEAGRRAMMANATLEIS